MSLPWGRTDYAVVEVATHYTAADTVIALATGDGARLPLPSTAGGYWLGWWDETTYPGAPWQDPNREITWAGSRATDTLVVSRGALAATGGGAASTKNTSGSTYRMVLAPVTGVFDLIEARLANDITVNSARFGLYAAGSAHLATSIRSGFVDISHTASLYTVTQPILPPVASGTTPLPGALYRATSIIANAVCTATSPVALQVSFNVGSIARVVAGQYLLYFTTSPATHAYVIQAHAEGQVSTRIQSGTITRSTFGLEIFNAGGALTDAPALHVTVVGAFE